MKRDEPGDQPDQQAEIQPDERQADGVDTTPRIRQTPVWPRTKPAIAASISRARPRTGLAVRQRHPAVDASRPCGPSRRSGRTRPPASRRAARTARSAPARRTTARSGTPVSQPGALGHQIADRTCSTSASSSPRSLCSQGRLGSVDERLQLRDIARQVVDEAPSAGRQDRRDQQRAARRTTSTNSADDQQRRHAAADARAAPAGRRADRADRRAPCRRRTAAGSSLSSHSSSDEDGERREPRTIDLPLESHASPHPRRRTAQLASTSGFRRVHVAHPFGDIEGDREQGQDGDQRHHAASTPAGIEIEAERRPAPGRRARSAPRC